MLLHGCVPAADVLCSVCVMCSPLSRLSRSAFALLFCIRVVRVFTRYCASQVFHAFLSLRCPKSLHFSVFVHSLWPRDRTIYPGLSVSLSGPPSDHETDVSCCVVSCFRCVALAVLIVPQSAAAESHHAILHLSSLCRIWTYMLSIR